MIARIVGALIRACLVVTTFILPSAVLPTTSDDLALLTLLVALFMGGLTFVEYASSAPSLIEFRFAPPYNAIRFAALVFLLALTLCVVQTPVNGAMQTVDRLAGLLARGLDLPASPLRFLPAALATNAPAAQIATLSKAGAISLTVALGLLVLFWAVTRYGRWPDSRHPFNLWTNMPTFYCASDANVARKLRRDAVANVVLGVLLLYIFPITARLLAEAFVSLQFGSPLQMAWMVVAWAYLPTGLFMRAIAVCKIARDLDRIKARQSAAEQGFPA